MQFTLSLGELLVVAGSLLGTLWAAIEYSAKQFEKIVSLRIASLEQSLKARDEDFGEIKAKTERTERDLADFKNTVATNYVQRNEMIRLEASLFTRLDGLATMIQKGWRGNGTT